MLSISLIFKVKNPTKSEKNLVGFLAPSCPLPYTRNKENHYKENVEYEFS